MTKVNPDFSRRQFLTKGTLAVSGAIALPTFSIAKTLSKNKKIKAVLVGTGSRGSGTWGKDLVESYSEFVDLVGLCDSNAKRVEVAKGIIGTKAKTYHADNFDSMIKQQKPDVVIVTTTDCYHVDYICRAMELGCDAVLLNTAVAKSGRISLTKPITRSRVL